jgi:ABC-type lipopolysaccharide export system ATPase subunit
LAQSTVGRSPQSPRRCGCSAKQALKVADRGDVVGTGRIAMEGAADELLDNPEIGSACLASERG